MKKVFAICNIHSSRTVRFAAQFLFDIYELDEFWTVKVSKTSFVALIPCFCMMFPNGDPGSCHRLCDKYSENSSETVCHVYSIPFSITSILHPEVWVNFGWNAGNTWRKLFKSESYFLERNCADNATNVISRQQDSEKTIIVRNDCNYVFKTTWPVVLMFCLLFVFLSRPFLIS